MTRPLQPILASLLVAASTWALAEAPTVKWEQDLLTVKAQDVPMRDLLREIGEKTGTPIEGLQYVEGKTTFSIEKAPLPVALQKLLGNRSHAWATLNKRPPGKSGIELQFPPPVKGEFKGEVKPASTRPAAGNVIVEESWVGPDGKPRFEVTTRPAPDPAKSAAPPSSGLPPPARPDPK